MCVCEGPCIYEAPWVWEHLCVCGLEGLCVRVRACVCVKACLCLCEGLYGSERAFMCEREPVCEGLCIYVCERTCVCECCLLVWGLLCVWESCVCVRASVFVCEREARVFVWGPTLCVRTSVWERACLCEACVCVCDKKAACGWRPLCVCVRETGFMLGPVCMWGPLTLVPLDSQNCFSDYFSLGKKWLQMPGLNFWLSVSFWFLVIIHYLVKSPLPSRIFLEYLF